MSEPENRRARSFRPSGEQTDADIGLPRWENGVHVGGQSPPRETPQPTPEPSNMGKHGYRVEIAGIDVPFIDLFNLVFKLTIAFWAVSIVMLLLLMFLLGALGITLDQ